MLPRILRQISGVIQPSSVLSQLAEDRWTVPTWTPDERWKDKGTVRLGRYGMFNYLERRADGLEILVPAWRVEGILGAVILDEVFESN